MKKPKREKPPKGTWKNILKTIFSCCPFSAAFYIIWVLACVAASFFTLIMLDEPTGAIDPNNEQTILKGFLEAMRDKTALIVTHRLSLCRFTDEILFLEQGKITERGSHEQLMRLNGKYREMYEMQSEWYQ